MSEAPDAAARLQQLRGRNQDVLAAAIVTVDGFAVHSDLSPGVEAESVAALAADLHTRASRTAQELGHGSVSELFAKSEGGLTFVLRINNEMLLTCIAAEGASIGLLMLDLRRAAAELAQAV